MYVLNKKDAIYGSAGTADAVNIIISAEKFSTDTGKNKWILQRKVLSPTSTLIIDIEEPDSKQIEYITIHTITLTNFTGSQVNNITLNLQNYSTIFTFVSSISIKPHTTVIFTKEGGVVELPVPVTSCVTNVSGGGGGGAESVYNEIPSGLIDEENLDFTTANPYVATTLRVYKNGQRLTLGQDYTETYANIFTLIYDTHIGDVLLVDYEKDTVIVLP